MDMEKDDLSSKRRFFGGLGLLTGISLGARRKIPAANVDRPWMIKASGSGDWTEKMYVIPSSLAFVLLGCSACFEYVYVFAVGCVMNGPAGLTSL